MYRALDISSYFINKGVSPLKLQKLLYYSQVWWFVKKGYGLYNDPIQAWIYGPAIYSVWDKFRFIKRTTLIPTTNANAVSDVRIDCDTLNHLDEVWDAYGHLTGSDLVDLTHSELPWMEARKGMLPHFPSGKEIQINRHSTQEYILNYDNKIPFATISKSKGSYSNI